MKFPFPSEHTLWPTGQFSNTTGLTDTQACLTSVLRQSPRRSHTIQLATSPPNLYLGRESNLYAQENVAPLMKGNTTLECRTSNSIFQTHHKNRICAWNTELAFRWQSHFVFRWFCNYFSHLHLKCAL